MASLSDTNVIVGQGEQHHRADCTDDPVPARVSGSPKHHDSVSNDGIMMPQPKQVSIDKLFKAVNAGEDALTNNNTHDNNPMNATSTSIIVGNTMDRTFVTSNVDVDVSDVALGGEEGDDNATRSPTGVDDLFFLHDKCMVHGAADACNENKFVVAVAANENNHRQLQNATTSVEEGVNADEDDILNTSTLLNTSNIELELVNDDYKEQNNLKIVEQSRGGIVTSEAYHKLDRYDAPNDEILLEPLNASNVELELVETVEDEKENNLKLVYQSREDVMRANNNDGRGSTNTKGVYGAFDGFVRASESHLNWIANEWSDRGEGLIFGTSGGEDCKGASAPAADNHHGTTDLNLSTETNDLPEVRDGRAGCQISDAIDIDRIIDTVDDYLNNNIEDDAVARERAAEAQAVANELDELRAQLASTTEQLTNATTQLSTVKQQNSTVKQLNKQLKSEITAAKETTNSSTLALSLELEEVRYRLTSTSSELEDANTKLSTLQGDSDELQSELAILKFKHETSTELSSKEIASLRENLDTMKNRAKTSKGKLESERLRSKAVEEKHMVELEAERKHTKAAKEDAASAWELVKELQDVIILSGKRLNLSGQWWNDKNIAASSKNDNCTNDVDDEEGATSGEDESVSSSSATEEQQVDNKFQLDSMIKDYVESVEGTIGRLRENIDWRRGRALAARS